MAKFNRTVRWLLVKRPQAFALGLLLLLSLTLAIGIYIGQEKDGRPQKAAKSSSAVRSASAKNRDASKNSSLVLKRRESASSIKKRKMDAHDEEGGGIVKAETRIVHSSINPDEVDLDGIGMGSFRGLSESGSKIESIQERVRSDIEKARSKAVKDRAKLKKEAFEESPSAAGDDYVDLFTFEDLEHLAGTGAIVSDQGGSLIPGIHSSRQIISEAPPPIASDPAEEPVEEQQPNQPTVPPRYTGQSRGYAMLYLMHPAAQATVSREIQTLIESEIREVYLGVLTDGTFGKNLPYLAQVLRQLNAEGRIITLALYLTNGATQRHYSTTPITAGFTKVNPYEFRALIRFDPATRSAFQEMAAEVKPVFELNLSLNPANRNIAIVMLEDNLRAESYLAMRELAHSILGDLVEFVRNPCQGCLEGNDAESFGDPVEFHNASEMVRLNGGDGYTLDGEGFYFPWEDRTASALSIEQVLELMQASQAKGLGYFGLWRSARQGLTQGGSVHPDQRNYEVPSADQIQMEIAILRSGLAAIE